MKHRDDTIETLFLHEMDKLIESVRSQMREKLRDEINNKKKKKSVSQSEGKGQTHLGKQCSN